MAGMGRPWGRPKSLDFYGFRNCKRILKLDTGVSDGAVHFCMSQQQLNSAQVARLFVNLRNLCTPYRMSSIGAGIQTDRGHPVTDNSGLVTG